MPRQDVTKGTQNDHSKQMKTDAKQSKDINYAYMSLSYHLEITLALASTFHILHLYFLCTKNS